MKNNELTQRFMVLHTALSETDSTGYFSVWERMLINQERGYLLSIGTEEELRYYNVPLEIEEKIIKLNIV